MNHDGKTHSLGVYDTLTDAKAALSIARSEAARGVFVPPAERRASGIAPNTAIVLRSCINAAVKEGAGGLTAF